MKPTIIVTFTLIDCEVLSTLLSKFMLLIRVETNSHTKNANISRYSNPSQNDDEYSYDLTRREG